MLSLRIGVERRKGVDELIQTRHVDVDSVDEGTRGTARIHESAYYVH
jgi:hypothetical protein